MTAKEFIYGLPKAELHIHLDGTIEPDLLLTFAERNKIRLHYTTIEQVEAAYQFNNKDQFLALFRMTTQVLRTEQDFYDLTWAYIQKSASQGLKHVELIFETQSYALRGMSTDLVIQGMFGALKKAYEQYEITSWLLLCFLRHFSPASAMEALQASLPYKDIITAIDLACSEAEGPASKFVPVFEQARTYGYHLVAHTGEEGGPSSIEQAIKLLHLERLDHGVRAAEDKELMQDIKKRQLPLTVCPLSNIALGLYPTLAQHPIKKLLEHDLIVSINSDDPAYFGSQYIADNYYALYEHKLLSMDELITCARNSFISSFISIDEKKRYLKQLDDYVAMNVR